MGDESVSETYRRIVGQLDSQVIQVLKNSLIMTLDHFGQDADIFHGGQPELRDTVDGFVSFASFVLVPGTTFQMEIKGPEYFNLRKIVKSVEPRLLQKLISRIAVFREFAFFVLGLMLS